MNLELLEKQIFFDIIRKESIVNTKVYNNIISGKSDNNIHFADFRNLILELGFTFKGQNGSHMVFYHKEINERMIIQKDGSKAKGYQVRQLRAIILKHDL